MRGQFRLGFIGGLAASLLVCAPQGRGAEVAQDKTVRVIYLVSRDREVSKDYQEALEKAIRELQQWYARQLKGPTFKLHSPVVEVARSSQNADWFYSHPNGENRDDWGFNNTLTEANRLLGARYDDPNYIWVIYSDGPGDKGRGGSGVTCLPEDDLLGLIGKHPIQKKPARWVGGLGHELGHAFGLPHPRDTTRDAEALMWAGFYDSYPGKTYLTDSDRAILLGSPFFFDVDGKPVTAKQAFSERYDYSGGYFGKVVAEGKSTWKEGKTESSECFYFEEIKRDTQMILLKDPSRNLSIQLPIVGGRSKLSVDGGSTWTDFYEVKRSLAAEKRS